MNAFRAAKANFVPSPLQFAVRSRDAAISAALEDDAQIAVHEQVVDPMVYRAASELIRLDDEGQKTDIEAQGPVYDVLQTVESELMDLGASRFAATQILDTLKTYISGLGADFARQAKAKPLYARVMVTDKEPEDIPDCKLSSITCIDGNRVQGDDAGKMSMTLTLYGTSNAMSQGMSMDRIFESGKKKWLMVYYGTIESADLNKFDTVDADLATLVQAVGAGGGAAAEDIRKAIEQGTLSPEIMKLIATVAELNRTVESARTPGAIEKPEQKIAELKAAILEISQSIPDIQAVPQVLLQAVMQTVESADAAFTIADVATAVETPSNDNDTISIQTGSVLEQITTLLENEVIPAETKQKLIALIEEVGTSLPDKNFAQMETAMAQIKETLIDFAASDNVSPQIFRAISEILPAAIVAEKQIGEAAARPPVAEAQVLDKASDAVPPELMQTVVAIQALTADKIETILKDENTPVDVKEKLRDMAKAVDAAIQTKDFSSLAIAANDMQQSLVKLVASDLLSPQINRSLAEAVPILAAAGQTFAEALPNLPGEKAPINPGLTQEVKIESKGDNLSDIVEAKVSPGENTADLKNPDGKISEIDTVATPKPSGDGVAVEGKALEVSTGEKPDGVTVTPVDAVKVEDKGPVVVPQGADDGALPKPSGDGVAVKDKAPEVKPTGDKPDGIPVTPSEGVKAEAKGLDGIKPAGDGTFPKPSGDGVAVKDKAPEVKPTGEKPDSIPVTPSEGVKVEAKGLDGTKPAGDGTLPKPLGDGVAVKDKTSVIKQNDEKPPGVSGASVDRTKDENNGRGFGLDSSATTKGALPKTKADDRNYRDDQSSPPLKDGAEKGKAKSEPQPKGNESPRDIPRGRPDAEKKDKIVSDFKQSSANPNPAPRHYEPAPQPEPSPAPSPQPLPQPQPQNAFKPESVAGAVPVRFVVKDASSLDNFKKQFPHVKEVQDLKENFSHEEFDRLLQRLNEKDKGTAIDFANKHTRVIAEPEHDRGFERPKDRVVPEKTRDEPVTITTNEPPKEKPRSGVKPCETGPCNGEFNCCAKGAAQDDAVKKLREKDPTLSDDKIKTILADQKAKDIQDIAGAVGSGFKNFNF